MKSVTLYYRNGGSDKVYQTAIEPRDNLFIVSFAFGRRGMALQTGVKTPEPVDLPTAEQVFDKLVREKTAKGYTPGESGTPYTQSDLANRDAGIRPQLLNSVDEEEAMLLLADPLWCLQEKKDGRRLLIKKLGSTIQGINRRGLICSLPSSLLQELMEFETDFIIDGEIVNETLLVFDLLRCGDRDWTPLPYRNRLNALEALLADDRNRFVRQIETISDTRDKTTHLQKLQKSGAEGVVFKLLSAPYAAGRPNSGGPARKYKFTTSGSFIVEAVNASRSVRLKLFREKESCGNVTIPPNHSLPEVGAVVEVRYLYAFRGGSLYQPVYLGLRDDIDQSECIVDQIKFKREENDDDGE